ncbi:MAG: AMP-binding protein [Luteolibacter sp.]
MSTRSLRQPHLRRRTNPKRHVNFDLFFNLSQSDQRMVVECEYNTDLHDAATIRRWLGAFQQLIASAIEKGDSSLDELRFWHLPSASRRSSNGMRPSALSELDRQPTRLPVLPIKVAIRCGQQTLTYAELESQAATLAARLQASGVKRGDLVGIHLERSTAMVTGLLAILKCGAAYVPIGPRVPDRTPRLHGGGRPHAR